MVKISYLYKKNSFLERERERKKQVSYKSHFIISFRNRPTRITNIIINTVNTARLFLFPSLHNKSFQLKVGYLEKNNN